MKLRKFLVRYRLPIALLIIAFGVYVTIESGFWPAFVFYLVGALMIFVHFFIGPITLIQKLAEEGDIEEAQKFLNQVKYPNLLYKPIRSVYYMLQSQFATLTDDFDTAESHIRKSINSGGKDQSLQGTAYLQLGMIAMKKGDTKEALTNLRKAVKAGIPDKDSEAGAYLQLASIMANRKDFRSAKNYFRKAKSLKPSNPEIKNQINDMNKYMSSLPG